MNNNTDARVNILFCSKEINALLVVQNTYNCSIRKIKTSLLKTLNLTNRYIQCTLIYGVSSCKYRISVHETLDIVQGCINVH